MSSKSCVFCVHDAVSAVCQPNSALMDSTIFLICGFSNITYSFYYNRVMNSIIELVLIFLVAINTFTECESMGATRYAEGSRARLIYTFNWRIAFMFS